VPDPRGACRAPADCAFGYSLEAERREDEAGFPGSAVAASRIDHAARPVVAHRHPATDELEDVVLGLAAADALAALGIADEVEGHERREPPHLPDLRTDEADRESAENAGAIELAPDRRLGRSGAAHREGDEGQEPRPTAVRHAAPGLSRELL